MNYQMSRHTIFSRTWAMPNKNTFDVPEICCFVKKYLRHARVSIDPFARNKRLATFTNDLDPHTAAEYHMPAEAFLDMLIEKRIVADLAILDPPYSPRQIKESYNSIGIEITLRDTQIAAKMKRIKERINMLIRPGGVCLSFGWNTVGMGNGWEINEIMLVCHGGAHNDTICMAETKQQHSDNYLL